MDKRQERKKLLMALKTRYALVCWPKRQPSQAPPQIAVFKGVGEARFPR